MEHFLVERRFGHDAPLSSIRVDPMCFLRFGEERLERAVVEQLVPVVRILLGAPEHLPSLVLVAAREDWRAMREERLRALERSVAQLESPVALVVQLDDADSPHVEVTLQAARRRIAESAASLCETSTLVRRAARVRSVLLVGWWRRCGMRDSTVFVVDRPPCLESPSHRPRG